jgi:hypothetical protein
MNQFVYLGQPGPVEKMIPLGLDWVARRLLHLLTSPSEMMNQLLTDHRASLLLRLSGLSAESNSDRF